MRRSSVWLVGLIVATVAVSASFAEAAPGWMTRTGTIGHGAALRDGEHIYLDAVVVVKIRPAYFVLQECFDPKARLIVCASPASELRCHQTVDVEGDLATLPSGERGLVNARTLAYTDQAGTILYHGPLIKGLLEPTPWPWKTALGSPSGRDSDAPAAGSDGAPLSLDSESDSATYYETIGSILGLPDATLVELQCKRVVSTGSDPTYGSYFIMGEDSGSDTIRVYFSSAVNQTDRVNKVSGQLRTQGSNRVLCVNSGPSYEPQLYVGSAQMVVSGSIAWVKTFPEMTQLPTDGRAHALEGKRVAWVNDAQRFSIQEPDGSSGILVNGSTVPPEEPCSVNVDGWIVTNDDGEREISGSAAVTLGGCPVRPVGMTNAMVGGSDLNAYTLVPAPAAIGLHNIGMLVRVWGRVTAVSMDYNCFYINDGSNRSDDTQDPVTYEPNVGIRVTYADTTFPEVGDYVTVTGACGVTRDWLTWNPVICVKTTGLQDVKMYPPRVAPDGLSATGCNGKVLLSWNPLNADKYNVYRSTSETGTYSCIGYPTSSEHTDTSVTNGTTYWYKVSAVNDDAEGPQSEPAQATPTSSAPIVTISSATTGNDGLLTLQCSGSSSTALYSLSVDDELVWSFTQSEIGNISYDTTQLPNGSHKVEVWATTSDASGLLSGMDVRTISVQNYISEFNVPDDICGLQAISAQFPGQSDWTLTCVQGSTTLYTTSGTGTSIEVLWDGGSTSGDFDVTLTAAAAGDAAESEQSSGQTKTVKARKVAGNNPRPPWCWSSIYVADVNSGLEDCYALAHEQASDCLFDELGVTLEGYSTMIDSDNDWQDHVIDAVLDGPEIPADIFVFSGHGIIGGTSPRSPLSQGGILGKFPGSGYSQGSGLTAFVAITPYLAGTGSIEAVGPALGNSITWDSSTGRYSNWDCQRRLKFVFLGACEAGKGVMSLAFGVPRGTYYGKGRAFLGFASRPTGGQLDAFAQKFWSEWKRSAVTLGEAATRAYWACKRKVKYVLNGDPNLQLW